MLAKILKERLDRKGLALRPAAEQIGISHTTLARVLRGDTVDFPTLVQIAKWAGMSVSSVVDTFSEDKDSAVLSGITALVEAEPELKEILMDAGRMVEEGSISPEDMREIIAYAAYRLDVAKRNLINVGKTQSHQADRGGY